MIRVRSGDRILIVGQTGSGKSTLASAIAAAWPRVLVLDPKLDPGAILPNSHVAVGVADAAAALPGRVIYRPTPADLDDLPTVFDSLVHRIMRGGGGCGILLHEAADVSPSSGSRRWLNAAWRQGRSLHVPIIACTQRPSRVDRLAISEAAHVFLFTLTDLDDRERIARVMGRPARDLPNLSTPFAFYHRGPDGTVRRCRPLTL